MSKIQDMIRLEAIKSLEKEARVESTTTKAVTVRLPTEYVQMIDNLAERLGVNRQSLLSDLITSASDDAVAGYASIFHDPESVVAEIYRQSGFIDKFTSADYKAFCDLNNLDPRDPSSEASFVNCSHLRRNEEDSERYASGYFAVHKPTTEIKPEDDDKEGEQ